MQHINSTTGWEVLLSSFHFNGHDHPLGFHPQTGKT